MIQSFLLILLTNFIMTKIYIFQVIETWKIINEFTNKKEAIELLEEWYERYEIKHI